jgi:hypothetical protein
MPRNPEFMKTSGGIVLRISCFASFAHPSASGKSKRDTSAEAFAISPITSPLRVLSVKETKTSAGIKKSETTENRGKAYAGNSFHLDSSPYSTIILKTHL